MALASRTISFLILFFEFPRIQFRVDGTVKEVLTYHSRVCCPFTQEHVGLLDKGVLIGRTKVSYSFPIRFYLNLTVFGF